jgi:hypothetical protein
MNIVFRFEHCRRGDKTGVEICLAGVWPIFGSADLPTLVSHNGNPRRLALVSMAREVEDDVRRPSSGHITVQVGGVQAAMATHFGLYIAISLSEISKRFRTEPACRQMINKCTEKLVSCVC